MNKLLSIKSNWDNNCIRDSCIWRSNVDLSVTIVGNLLLDCTISHSDVANTFLVETFTCKMRESSTSAWPFIRGHRWDGWVNIVNELDQWLWLLNSIQGNWYVVERSVLVSKAHAWRKRRRVTLDEIGFHDCCVHKDGLVKNTFDSSESHIKEVFAMDCNLGVPSNWATSRNDAIYIWCIIVKIVYWRWSILLSFVRDSKRDNAWLLNRGRNAKDFCFWKPFAANWFFSEGASNVFVWSEFVTPDIDLSSSFSWTFSWINFEYFWWGIVIIPYIIVCILLVV